MLCVAAQNKWTLCTVGDQKLDSDLGHSLQSNHKGGRLLSSIGYRTQVTCFFIRGSTISQIAVWYTSLKSFQRSTNMALIYLFLNELVDLFYVTKLINTSYNFSYLHFFSHDVTLTAIVHKLRCEEIFIPLIVENCDQ